MLFCAALYRETASHRRDFLKSLTRRGLRGVKLVISDAHEGLKAAIRRVFGAGWQRCRVHWMRNALAYVPKTQQSMVAAALRQAFLDRPLAGEWPYLWLDATYLK
jgi:putative transposase